MLILSFLKSKILRYFLWNSAKIKIDVILESALKGLNQVQVTFDQT